MKNENWLIFPLLLAVVAGLVAQSCAPSDTELSEEDRLARNDDNGTDKYEPPEEIALFPDTAVGKKLSHHMEVLALPAETLEEADQRYATSLAELKKHPSEVLELLSKAYGDIRTTRYFERWGLTKTLADLEDPAAYGALSSIAKSPIPPERSEDLHHFSTREEEEIIRLRAVEGLAALATEGHTGAEQDLLALATDPAYPHSALQVRAIKGYLKAGQDTEARIRLLKGKLPKDLHGIVTLEVTPREDFEARVSELASVSPEDTTKDAAEEELPNETPPEVKKRKGDQQYENQE